MLSAIAGASFIRADLHVHTFPDREGPAPDLGEYIDVARERQIDVLGITDHNTIKNVEEAIGLGRAANVLVLPGIEVTTHQGHLLALFDPDDLQALRDFAAPTNLDLKPDAVDRSVLRSPRSMIDLVAEVGRRGGIPVPAHVDAQDGIATSLNPSELAQLLSDPSLGGLEFRDAANLTWFTDADTDPVRRDAWLQRHANGLLRKRGLARIMSSDAHAPAGVGLDRIKRTMTRLRLDERNFIAVKNALVHNPKARCKPEATLPANYPRIVSIGFEGGFLDGVNLEFSPNLTSIIGGRGSGKSTALLALRAAVGEATDENPDAPERMPDRTTIRFVDELGTEREAIRDRGQPAVESASGAPVSLALADLGQDETGRLARGYEDDPSVLLEFLDRFVDGDDLLVAEADALRELTDWDAEVSRSGIGLEHLPGWRNERARLQAQLDAAKTGKIDEIVEFAAQMEAQLPLLTAVEERVNALLASDKRRSPIALDEMALQHGADLTKKPASDFVSGPDGLRAQLQKLDEADTSAKTEMKAAVTLAATGAKTVLQRWRDQHLALERRLQARVEELAEQGLKVEAQASIKLAKRLQTAIETVARLTVQERRHRESRRERERVLKELSGVRDSIFELRRAKIRLVVEAANRAADQLKIHFALKRGGVLEPWENWLGPRFQFRSPRLQRITGAFTPEEFASAVRTGAAAIEALKDLNGDAPFADRGESVVQSLSEQDLTGLDRMRLEDRPELSVSEPGRPKPRSFSELSAGQQRSVLLSLLLCAERSEPLVIDQPEDHLDAEYISNAVVGHLEAAKERRQVILATHSANLTVLGDAELVVPMYADGAHGAPQESGAVDRKETRERVCALLEGGEEAFKERGRRYGFKFQ